MERGSRDPYDAIEEAIQSYFDVFNDSHNMSPQTFSWFGVTYITQHRMFELYADFESYGSDNAPEGLKRQIANAARKGIFPQPERQAKLRRLF
jgi:hypothetical protein